MRTLLKIFLSLIVIFFHLRCSKKDGPEVQDAVIPAIDNTIRAADVSFLPEIETAGIVFYNSQNQPEKMLTTLKKAGCNTVRIRLWHNPTDGNSGMTQVKALVAQVKSEGLKVWITVHYSDTWADPGNQSIPSAWQNLNFSDLKTAVVAYTSSVLTELNPDIIQIGNETNNGFLWPAGKLTTNESQFLELVSAASARIRSQSPNTKIMLHFAGVNYGTNTDASWFFNKTRNIDFDYIGLSYYPMYHGKNLNDVKSTIQNLGSLYNKKVIIAETAYPFTFGYNDWTNNIVGLPSQIIPAFAATPDGQMQYLNALKSKISESTFCLGFAYWGTEWVSFKGNQATNGSSYENQALWDFNNKVLPAIDVFKK